MRKLALALAVPSLLVIAACGADTKSCSTAPAKVAASDPVASCTAAAGSTVNIPVRLCAGCSDSSPSCNAEFRNGTIEIDPIFRQCTEDQGCPVTGSCSTDPSVNETTCSVAIPSGTSGSIPVFLASTATRVSTVTVGSSSGCSFSARADGSSAP